MHVDVPLVFFALSSLTDAEVSPEARRAAAELILREIEPHIVAALDGKPVVAALVTLAVDVIDKAEGGLTMAEGIQVLGALGKVLTVSRRDEARATVARPTVAGIIESARRRAGG